MTPPEHPHHSSDAFMDNATPVQSFVTPAIPVAPGQVVGPRYGRPDRRARAKPGDTTPVQSFVDTAHEPTEEERTRPRYGRPGDTPPAAPQ